jgi:hypothetical protein
LGAGEWGHQAGEQVQRQEQYLLQRLVQERRSLENQRLWMQMVLWAGPPILAEQT